MKSILNLSVFQPIRLRLSRFANLTLWSAILGLLLPWSVSAQRASSVVEWGVVSDDGVAMPPDLTNIVAVAAGGNPSILGAKSAYGWTVALRNDGTVVSWGTGRSGVRGPVPSEIVGVTAIAAGDNHAVFLKNDGTVVAWGENYNGQTDIPKGLTGVAAIAPAGDYTLALKTNGLVVAWGVSSHSRYGQTIVPERAFSGVTAIAAGGRHAVALKNDGTLIAWGDNTYGQCAVPADLREVVAIAASAFMTIAVRRDGTVVAVGSGAAAIPSGLDGVTAVAAGYAHFVALRVDGTVVAWGLDANGQATIPADLNGVTTIAAGPAHTVAVRVPGPRGAAATAQVVNGFVVGGILTDGGYGYIDTPAVTISGGAGTGATAKATVVDGVVTAITLLNPGSGYTSAPTITIAPPPFPPKRATAIAQVANGGVTSITVTERGHGYDTPPAVLLLGGDGTGATATATVADNEITGITITHPGTGYTSPPKVSIASPAFAPGLAIEISRVRVQLKVLLGHRYLLESSQDLNTWTATGDPFVAQEEILVQEFDVDTTGRFFRINQVP